MTAWAEDKIRGLHLSGMSSEEQGEILACLVEGMNDDALSEFDRLSSIPVLVEGAGKVNDLARSLEEVVYEANQIYRHLGGS